MRAVLDAADGPSGSEKLSRNQAIATESLRQFVGNAGVLNLRGAGWPKSATVRRVDMKAVENS